MRLNNNNNLILAAKETTRNCYREQLAVLFKEVISVCSENHKKNL